MDVLAAKALGAGIAVIALAGVGIGIGNIFASMVSSVARNPGARDAVFPIGILGFALTEAVALFALLNAFLILFTSGKRGPGNRAFWRLGQSHWGLAPPMEE